MDDRISGPERSWHPTLEERERDFCAGGVNISAVIQHYDRWKGTSAGFDEAMARLRGIPHDMDGITLVGYSITTVTRASRFRPLSSDPVLAELAKVEIQTLIRTSAIWMIPDAELPQKGCVHNLIAVYRSSSCKDRARIIADLRALNAAGPDPETFSLPSFANVDPTAKWAVKIDLVAGFHAVRMSRRSARFTQASLNGGWFWWKGMPMGWSHAPIIFTRVLDPLVEWLRAQGCQVIKYLDDFLITGGTPREVERARDMLISGLHDLGFVISVKKSVLVPTQKIIFLGMGIDLVEKTFFWPQDKAENIGRIARELIEDCETRGRVQTRKVQSLIGKLAFLCQVVPLAASWRRDLEKCLRSDEWEIPLTAEAISELKWWTAASEELRGTDFPMEKQGTARFVLRGDASETGFGIRLQDKDGRWTRIALLMPRWLQGTSSGLREIYCTIAGLRILAHHHKDELLHARIDVFTDSTASVGAMKRGGKTSSMAFATKLMLGFTRRFRAVIDPHWLRRDEMMEEDALSRAGAESAAEAMTEQRLINHLATLLWGHGITFDAFATSVNSRADRFASRWCEADSSTVDGVTARWPEGTWAFPPFALGRKVARKVASIESQSLSLLESSIPAPSHIRRIPIHGEVRLWSPPFFEHAMRPPRELSLWVTGRVVSPDVRVNIVCCVSRVRTRGAVVQVHETVSPNAAEPPVAYVPGIDCDHGPLDHAETSFPLLRVARHAIPAVFRYLRTQGIEDVFIVATAEDVWNASRLQDSPRLTWAWVSRETPVAD